MKRQYGLVVALGAFFLYYVLLSAGMSLAEGGVLEPAVGLWLPNALFLAAALAGIRMAAEERGWNPAILKYFSRRGPRAGGRS